MIAGHPSFRETSRRSHRDSQISPSSRAEPVRHTGKGDLLMADMMANRRNAPRYPLILRAEVTELSSGAKLNARTSDLSRTGCYIDTRQPLSSGAAISIK